MPKKKKQARVSKSSQVASTEPPNTPTRSAPRPRSGGGGLMRMRSGIQGAVHGDGKNAKPKTLLGRAFDIVFYLLLAAAVGFFFYNKFRKYI